jgi:enoyl-CoA hydratase/carnithine racemase
MSDIKIEDRATVRTITLDRPDSRNALTEEVCRSLTNAINENAARVIVLTGANGAFCAGLDLKEAMRRGLKPSSPEAASGLREAFHGLIKAVVQRECPTIAAVDGAAAGFGCDLALACDLRIVSDRATFGEIFVKRGLMPDGGGTFFLPRIIGLGRALEMMYTGDLVTGEDALRIGLANRLVPTADLLATVGELADRLAKGPPLAYRLLKQAAYASLDGDLDSALDREAAGQLQLLGSADFAEGVMAFLQKRAAKFQGK